MRIKDWFNSIDRRVRLWYFTTTPAFRDYSRKIKELEDHAGRLHREADTIRATEVSYPKLEPHEPKGISVQQFTPREVKAPTQSMVICRREYQGGAENHQYELGDRFDALCNRLECQMNNGDRNGARTTIKALEEIDSRLKHRDKNRIFSKSIKTKNI